MKNFEWLFDAPIAHRGLHNDIIPENSMAAFQRAIENNYHIEIDVHLTSDGELVVFHDNDLTRMCNDPIKISAIPSGSLSDYRLKGTNHTIPLFKDLLQLVQGHVGLLIEVKHLFGSCDEICNKLYNLIKDYKGNVAVQSFAPKVVNWFKNNAPEIPRGLLSTTYNELKVHPIAKSGMKMLTKMLRGLFVKMSDPDFIAFNITSFPSPRLKTLKDKGMPFLAWTIRNNDQLELAKDWVDNVIFESIIIDKFVPNI